MLSTAPSVIYNKQTTNIMQAIPAIQRPTEDFACQKVHNATPSTNGLLICLDVDFDKKIGGDVKHSIEEWVYGCLDRAHKAHDYEFDWHFVANVRHDQRQEEDGGDTDNDSGDSNNKQNGLQVAVHFESVDTYAWPLFNEARAKVYPSDILLHFHTPPTCIRTVGISGVSMRCLRDEWAEMISTEPDSFDRPGKGYMTHPMYTLPGRMQDGTLGTCFSDACVRREMSFSFGWENYPPR